MGPVTPLNGMAPVALGPPTRTYTLNVHSTFNGAMLGVKISTYGPCGWFVERNGRWKLCLRRGSSGKEGSRWPPVRAEGPRPSSGGHGGVRGRKPTSG